MQPAIEGNILNLLSYGPFGRVLAIIEPPQQLVRLPSRHKPGFVVTGLGPANPQTPPFILLVEQTQPHARGDR
jgi:hypothetical protein